jgi:hypothetical protein
MLLRRRRRRRAPEALSRLQFHPKGKSRKLPDGHPYISLLPSLKRRVARVNGHAHEQSRITGIRLISFLSFFCYFFPLFVFFFLYYIFTLQ